MSNVGREGDISGRWRSWPTAVHGACRSLHPGQDRPLHVDGPDCSGRFFCLWLFSREWKTGISWFKCWERIHISAELHRGHTKHTCMLTPFRLLVYPARARPGHPLLLLALREGWAQGGGLHRDDLFPFRAQGLSPGRNPRVLQVPQ